MSISGLCQRPGRAEGHICPWEPVHATKMLRFAKFNEVVAVVYGEEDQALSPFSIAEI